MALSDTARRILAEAAQHPLLLVAPPDKLPIAAARAVLNNLLKQGYVEECAAPMEYIGLGWRKQDGAWTAVRATEAGLTAIGAILVTTAVEGADQAEVTCAVPADAAQEPGSTLLTAPAAPEALVPPTGTKAAHAPSTAALVRPSLRDAAHRVLAAWDDEADERAGLPDAIAALRAILVKPASAPRLAGPRKPREGTKQQQVLAMLRRPEGTTVAQIVEATGWQAHTVRGFFAGLKKRQGLAVESRRAGPPSRPRQGRRQGQLHRLPHR
ncbi:DUF3489 domain-containing protein [Dankookia sp. P2]|uniref:DUF3489 domain-containing protein n=1 Tax=Dankookia sp. P2 TaxID=3423955 RepID=UPI003D6669E0